MVSPSDPNKLSIIIPTYQEAENISQLVFEIAEVLRCEKIHNWDMHIIDDDSRDGTEKVCHTLVEKGYPVKLYVRRGEKDLSTAVLTGFARSDGDILLVMDADLSHPPSAIPELLQAIKQGHDFAFGSRYVSGGGIDRNWSIFRHLNSRVASMLTSGLVRVSDPMSGFFALPRRLLNKCPHIVPIGYKIGLEILVKSGAEKIAEVPIHFRDRRHGKSKLSVRQQLYYLRHLRWLYQFKYPRLAEIGHICVVGGSGFFLDILCFTALLKGFGVYHFYSRVASFIPGAVSNWYFHRWTSQISRKSIREKPYSREVLPVSIVSAVTNIGGYWCLTGFGGPFWSQPFVAMPAAVAFGALFNYMMYRHCFFRIMEQVITRGNDT